MRKVTSCGAGFAFATSRDNPQTGPTRRCSRQAQTLPPLRGHAASARLCVLAAASGFSIFTQPTRTALMIAPIPWSLTNDIPRFSVMALSCERYWQCCFTARNVASLSFRSEKSLTRSCTCLHQVRNCSVVSGVRGTSMHCFNYLNNVFSTFIAGTTTLFKCTL